MVEYLDGARIQGSSVATTDSTPKAVSFPRAAPSLCATSNISAISSLLLNILSNIALFAWVINSTLSIVPSVACCNFKREFPFDSIVWVKLLNPSSKFYIRIEDTDKVRSKPEFTENILKGLEWLGINWDNEDTDIVEDDCSISN